jgi:hypothetical protein
VEAKGKEGVLKALSEGKHHADDSSIEQVGEE